MATLAEYIWIDGSVPTKKLRSKTKVLNDLEMGATLESFPQWEQSQPVLHGLPCSRS